MRRFDKLAIMDMRRVRGGPKKVLRRGDYQNVTQSLFIEDITLDKKI